MTPDLGPTVWQAAIMRITQIDRQIAALREERESALRRAQIYQESKMLESERLATQAEALQATQFPEHA